MPGALSNDEISTSDVDIFRTDVYYKVLDVIINSINSRFNNFREIMIDLSLLSPERLISYRKCGDKSLPNNAFENLTKWINGIDLNKLTVEYLTFSSSLNELINGLTLKQPLDNTNINNLEDIESDSSNIDEDESNNIEKVSLEQILHILSSHDLISAFPNLYAAYKSLGTIPTSSESAKRSFSKVK